MATIHLVLGTAGHIDHGKTALVRALTGVDCDRLPEEKARGITIDLGFASLDLDPFQFGIVDVPGHERFVHNMVAGSTGIDLALLVIACDDSVMPQTVEHLAILDLLGVRAGIIALTKCDLVDEEHLSMVHEEVAELTAGTFLSGAPAVPAPVVPVSTVTGAGLDDLRAALIETAHKVEQEQATGAANRSLETSPFRLPIDRVFTLAGHGTVVTGTVRSGTAQVGDTLRLLPRDRDVRVRRLQAHGHDAERVTAGRRAAVNLAGVKLEEVSRGDELATSGCFAPTRRLLVGMRSLSTEKRPLKHRQLVRLHVAAREVTARVVMDSAALPPGASGYAVLLCAAPVVAEYGQRFILRRLSPVETIGGGRILAAAAGGIRTRRLLAAGSSLDAPEPEQRIAAWLELRGEDPLSEATLAVSLGIAPDEGPTLLEKLVSSGRILSSPGVSNQYMAPAFKERLKERIIRKCDWELERRRPARLVEAAPILSTASRWTSPPTAAALLDELVAEGRLIRRGDRIGKAGEAPRLTQREQDVLRRLVDDLEKGGPAPPLLKEFASGCGMTVKQLQPLVQVAIDQGRLVRVSSELAATPDNLEELRRGVVEWLSGNGPGTVTQIKDRWQVSRKYAVPYLEFFDEVGVTVREADTRIPGPNANRPLEEWLP